jgi:hypothetical protein
MTNPNGSPSSSRVAKEPSIFFIPDKDGPLAVLVLLHGSGRNGEIMVKEWKDLAAREGIVLVAPDAYLFPLEIVKATRQAFDANGFGTELTLLPKHDHNYYAIADLINVQVWKFLSSEQLRPTADANPQAN